MQEYLVCFMGLHKRQSRILNVLWMVIHLLIIVTLMTLERSTLIMCKLLNVVIFFLIYIFLFNIFINAIYNIRVRIKMFIIITTFSSGIAHKSCLGSLLIILAKTGCPISKSPPLISKKIEVIHIYVPTD